MAQAPVKQETPATEPLNTSQANNSEVVTDVEAIVREAARKYGINEDYFVKIAKCESSLNPNAINYNYSENGKDYPAGTFQHLQNYWPARAAKYGHPGASVFDPIANAEVTAQMFRDGLQHLWECKV